MTAPTLWALKGPDGTIYPGIIRQDIAQLMAVWTDLLSEQWDTLEREGYSIVRVKLEEVS
jgi:hypothetical protein